MNRPTALVSAAALAGTREGAGGRPVARARAQSVGLRSLASIAVGATLVLAPFDSLLWRLVIVDRSFTELEVAWVSTLIIWAAILVRERRGPALPVTALWSAVALVGVSFLSAFAAAPGDAAAFHIALRGAGSVLLFLAVADLVRTERTATRLVACALAGAALAAATALLAFVRGTSDGLLGFGRDFTVAGVIRVTGPFDYPNTAAMAWEAALLAGLPLAFLPLRRALRVGAAAALVLVGVAMVLTFSRGAILGALAGLAVIAAVAWIARRPKRAAATFATATALVIGALFAQAAAGIPLARITIESDADLYRAAYSAPAIVELPAGTASQVSVTLSNTGAVRWTPDGSHAFALDHHWIDERTGAILVLEGGRTALPRVVEPGDSVTLAARVVTPPRVGRLVLAWDLHQTGVGWLSEKGVLAWATTVMVGTSSSEYGPDDSGSAILSGPVQVWPELLPAPSRPELWTAAVEMVRAHPLLGVGPGNFRFLYGSYLGWSASDDRIHANDLYLELAATTGLLGLLAFLSLVAAAIWPQVRRLTGGRSGLLQAGLLAAIVAFLVHGVVDYFLGFAPVAILFWVLLGLGLGLALGSRREPSTLESVA